MSWIPLLLADPSPNLRYLVHRNLLKDIEAEELDQIRLHDPLIMNLFKLQQPDGSWNPTSIPGHSQGKTQATAQALTRLGYLQVPSDHESLKKGTEYLYSQQQPDGSWPLREYNADYEGKEHYDSMSIQTSIPLRGLAEAGYAIDPRANKPTNG